MAETTISPECAAFLSEGTRTGKLATVRANGGPHVVPIWFLVDGNRLVFNTGRDTIKGKNLARTGQASLCVDNEHPPFAYARIDGTVTLSEDAQELKYWATRIAARYMGEEQAEAYGARNGVEGELVVYLTPTKVIFEQNISD